MTPQRPVSHLERLVRGVVDLDARSLLTAVTVLGLAVAPGACAGGPEAVSTSSSASSSLASTLASSVPSVARTTADTTSVTPAAAASGEGATSSSASLSQGALDKAVTAALGDAAGDVGVTVIDRRTGARYSHNGEAEYEMASTTKVLVLAAFLRARREAGRELSAGDRSRVSAMIRYSDNAATTSLRASAGGGRAISRMARDAGMTHTADAALETFAWGKVATTSDEQASLMNLIADGGRDVIDPDDCEYILSEMRKVTPAQAWGVGSVKSPSVTVAVKNGWSPFRPTGLWAVNSIGLVQGDGRDYAIAVYEHLLRSQARGIQHKDAVVKAVHTALAQPLAKS